MKQLEVFMAGEHCGVLTQTGQGDLKFQYAPGYRSTPLSLSMPVSDATYI
jgi:HipA-like protein